MKKLLLTAPLAALALAGCRGFGASDVSDPTLPPAHIVVVNSSVTVDDLGVTVLCDRERGVLIYVADNYRMAAVPGGCAEESR